MRHDGIAKGRSSTARRSVIRARGENSGIAAIARGGRPAAGPEKYKPCAAGQEHSDVPQFWELKKMLAETTGQELDDNRLVRSVFYRRSGIPCVWQVWAKQHQVVVSKLGDAIADIALAASTRDERQLDTRDESAR